MANSEFEYLYNTSKRSAIRLYQNIKPIKTLAPFITCKFSLIANGLAISVGNTFYKGHVYIIEDKSQNLSVFFAPRERNPLYIKTSVDYLKIFTQLLKAGELK